MDTTQTPIKKTLVSNEIIIPPSPFMKCLGFGTGVTVYKLKRSPVCTQVQSPWAIKKIKQVTTSHEKRIRLENEAEILRKLNHPNIVGFRALTKDSHGEICLAMEACKLSLGDLIEDRSEDSLLAFPALDIAKVSYNISKAFNYLHNKAHILHCDVKSYNILVDKNFDVCKLCDFGISLPLKSDGTVSVEYLSEDRCLGTGPWMSPEALLDGVVTCKSDIYSYGIVIWEMIALTIPTQIEDNSSLDISVVDDSNCRPVLPAQEFNSNYDNILELFYCCTERNPEFRPSADLLQKACEEILDILLRHK